MGSDERRVVGRGGSIADRAAEEYAEIAGLRVLVGLIPYVGSAIDTLITGRANRLARERIEALLQELRVVAEHLDAKKVDQKFLASVEFHDLLIRGLRAATETRDREKIRVYAAILVGSTSKDRPPELDPEAALSAIAELSPTELRLAKVIYEHLRG